MNKIKLNLKQAVENSYRNFHAKGLDYICLSRSDRLTQKIYILDGDASKVPEVVNPHDHRYLFTTVVLKGRMLDHRWRVGHEDQEGAMAYNAFDYMTPLNGGNGFEYRGKEWLVRDEVSDLGVDQSLVSQPNKIHTIQMMSDQTVLLLSQFKDVVPLDTPTSTWAQGEPSIDDDGLYERFTEGEIVDRLKSVGIELDNSWS